MMALDVAILVVSLLTLVSVVFGAKRVRRSFKKGQKELLYNLGEHLGKLESRMVNPFVEWRGDGSGEAWVLVITRDRCSSLRRTIEQIRRFEPAARILVVDNGSLDGAPDLLMHLLREGPIDRLLLNKPGTVPQWQKCSSLQQGLRLLAIEKTTSITWVDDDVQIQKPWIADASRVMKALAARRVEVVSLLLDPVQQANHPPVETLEVEGIPVTLSRTFNGAFACVDPSFFKKYGLPPLGEGLSEASVEDWYYSRLIQASGGLCAFLECSSHLYHQSSLRERAGTE